MTHKNSCSSCFITDTETKLVPYYNGIKQQTYICCFCVQKKNFTGKYNLAGDRRGRPRKIA